MRERTGEANNTATPMNDVNNFMEHKQSTTVGGEFHRQERRDHLQNHHNQTTENILDQSLTRKMSSRNHNKNESQSNINDPLSEHHQLAEALSEDSNDPENFKPS